MSDCLRAAPVTMPPVPLPPGLAPSTAAAAATAAEAAATAARPCRHRLRLVDRQVAAAEVVVVQLLDRALRLLVGRHLDEAEPAGTTGGHVAHDLHALDGATACEQLFEVLLTRGVRKVPHVKFSTH